MDSLFRKGLYTAIITLCLSVFGRPNTALAQADTLKVITQKLTTYTQHNLPEKLFLHLDRPLYVSGETMWFKIYAVDGIYHKPLSLSKVAYVEVLDNAQRPVLQAKIPLLDATGQGSFVLPGSLGSGRYTVRAYTNWMKNFGPDFYFQSPVTIVNTLVAPNGKPAKDSVIAPAYAVQFFPEGGNLVKGLRSKVAFRVTDKTGQGLAAEGTLTDSQGQEVARFKTLKFGLGSFSFTPQQAGVAYTAVVRLANRHTISQKLPAAYEQGYVVQLKDSDTDQFKLSVYSSSPVPETIFLLAQTRQKLNLAIALPLANGQATTFIDKKQLADGIAHFTVFNAQKKPVCERLYFRQPQQTLTIAARPDQTRYPMRQRVVVPLTTTNQAAQPVAAAMSMAVYRLDSLSATPGADVSSFLWLTSDLKGTVEEPDYYFTHSGPEVREALDNLMLTHGWSRFRWENVLAGTAPARPYAPELNGHLIQGRVVSRATGAPATAIPVYLAAPSRRIQLFNAVSGEDGTIAFETKAFYGPKNLVVQTNTERDSTYRIELLPAFSASYSSRPLAPFVVSEAFRAELTERHLQTQVQAAYFKKYATQYRRFSTDSLAFYGKPDEMYLLDAYTRFKVMEEVMREYVPGVQVRIRKDGFHFMVLDKLNKTLFQDNPLVLLDGVPVFDISKMMALDPLKVQKLEVVTSNYFQGSLLYQGIVSYTTYKGDLGGFPLDPRALIQEYEGLQQQREFYAPRYETTPERQSRLPDLRNLLYWNPVIVTTATGQQQVEFYTSDQAGRYRVVVQGLTATGQPGHTSFTFEVKPTL